MQQEPGEKRAEVSSCIEAMRELTMLNVRDQTFPRTKLTKLVHPGDSPDAESSDSFLFGYVNREMAAFTVSSSEGTLSEIHWISEATPNELCTTICNGWITWLE
jgi:hypothetical protein